jgi:hypothetical protein
MYRRDGYRKKKTGVVTEFFDKLFHKNKPEEETSEPKLSRKQKRQIKKYERRHKGND